MSTIIEKNTTKNIIQERASQVETQIGNILGLPTTTGPYGNGKVNHVKNYNQAVLNREKAINGYKKIMGIFPEPGQSFLVCVWFLTTEIGKNGERGMLFPIKTCMTYGEAKDKAESVIKETGIDSVFVYPMCQWRSISDRKDRNHIALVSTDLDKNLNEQHKRQLAELEKEMKRHEEIADQIENEQEKEQDPTSIEHYIRNWFLAIRNKQLVDSYKKQAEEMESKYQLRLTMLQEQYSRQPEMESKFLPLLKEQLTMRDEGHIYKLIATEHEKLQHLVTGDK